MTDHADPAPSDMEDWFEPRVSAACRCGGDMPGRCPGPAACPMCQDDDEENAA